MGIDWEQGRTGVNRSTPESGRRAGQVGTGVMAAGEKEVGRSKDAETQENQAVWWMWHRETVREYSLGFCLRQ